MCNILTKMWDNSLKCVSTIVISTSDFSTHHSLKIKDALTVAQVLGPDSPLNIILNLQARNDRYLDSFLERL